MGPDLNVEAIRNEQKELGIAPIHKVNVAYETATFGMGCFWGAEALYGGTKGVIRTTVGYAGGSSDQPTYRNIGDHTEVLEIDFDPKVISFEKLLHLFWHNHEYGLSGKIKKQYMSLILYHNDEQKEIAEKSKIDEQQKRKPETISTVIKAKGPFYPAETYHQKYRLQYHRDLCQTLNLNPDLLENSYVATKLNGFLVGVGKKDTIQDEMSTLGLTPSQLKYCNYYFAENFGSGLFC